MSNGDQKSWWTTLPGILTASASLLTAAVGLVAAFKGVGDGPNKPPTLQPTNGSTVDGGSNKTQALQPTNESAAREIRGFHMVNLSPILNTPIDNLVTGGFWQVKTGFKSIPFLLKGKGENGAFQSQNQNYPERPTSALLKVNPQHVNTVYTLITGTYVTEELRDREVACVVLRFSNGSEIKLPLIALQHLRENWAFIDEPQQMNSSTVELLRWENVFKENQNRGPRQAEAYVDMVTITVPPPFSEYELTRIEFMDESQELLGSPNPALDVCAVTLEE